MGNEMARMIGHEISRRRNSRPRDFVRSDGGSGHDRRESFSILPCVAAAVAAAEFDVGVVSEKAVTYPGHCGGLGDRGAGR